MVEETGTETEIEIGTISSHAKGGVPGVPFLSSHDRYTYHI